MADQAAAAPKPRRVLPVVLILLASLIGIVSIFALWTKRQVLETDTWRDTSADLIQNETIRNAVAAYAVNQLFDNVDVQANLEARLEPVAPRLAAPLSSALAGGLRQLAGDAAQKALAEPKVQEIFVNVSSLAQQKLIALIDDKGQFVSTTSGVVSLDLSAIVAAIAEQTGLPNVADKLPPDIAQLQILRSDQLAAGQTALNALKPLAYILTALTLLLYALAIFLARGRRRETLRAVGIAFVFIGALVLVVHHAAGTAVTNSLATTASAEPAVNAVWEIGTSLLKETAQSIVFYGIVIVIAAWLAGPTRIATWIRDAIAPQFRRPGVAYGSLAILLVLLFWWDPTVSTHRFVPSLLLIGLLALGFEALRRQIIGEFPDRVTGGSAEGIAQSIASRMRESRERRVAAEGHAVASPDELRLAQLERLGKLHETGTLTDEEFAAEKQRVLTSA